MKKPSAFKKDLPFIVSSIMAAMSMGFLVSATSASDFEHADHVAPFIFAGIIALWVVFLFVWPAMVSDNNNDELTE